MLADVVAIALLFVGRWRFSWKGISLSPVEVAHAFGALLLTSSSAIAKEGKGAGSNEEIGSVMKRVGETRARHGAVREGGGDGGRGVESWRGGTKGREIFFSVVDRRVDSALAEREAVFGTMRDVEDVFEGGKRL